MKAPFWLASIVFGGVLATTAAQASDALATAPGNFRLVMENHKVRVLEATLKPKDKVGTHEQGEHMFYVLTDGTLVIEASGRTGYEMTFKAGESFWLPAQTRALQNDGDKPIKALIVEVGGSSRATPAPAASGKTSKSRSGRVVFQQRKRR
jgi:quercetin dioxygenase-like cupin family protein